MSTGTSLQLLDTAQVLVTFEYEPGEDGGRDSPSYAATFTVLSALVNGEETSAEYFAEWVVTKWELAIAEEFAGGDDFAEPDDERDEYREWAGMEVA